jgi:hypothetical protein
VFDFDGRSRFRAAPQHSVRHSPHPDLSHTRRYAIGRRWFYQDSGK